MNPQLLGTETAEYDPVEDRSETKMKSTRDYDIIVFGATGFTGQMVAMEMAKFSQKYNLRWTVAGRSMSKLHKVIDGIHKTHDYSIQKSNIIYADVHDIKTINEMTKSTSVIINCVGPYLYYGEVVVKYCILNSTHCVDVSIESLFMEKMAYLYNSEAEKNCSVIVNALGMMSVPADLGVEYLYKHFTGDLQIVEVYMALYNNLFKMGSATLINDGTWVSFILHATSKQQRIHYRNLLYESMGIVSDKKEVDRMIHKRQISTHNEKINWCLAIPEPNQSIITRSVNHAKTVDNLPYNFKANSFMVFKNWFSAIYGLFMIALFSLIIKLKCVLNLFIKYPSLVTNRLSSEVGPTNQLMKHTRLSLTIIGYGSVEPLTENKDDKLKCSVRKTVIKVEAKNAIYGFTSKAVVLGAITLLKDPNVPKGGVLTPASAFRKSQYINMLIEHHAAEFKIVSDIVYE